MYWSFFGGNEGGRAYRNTLKSILLAAVHLDVAGFDHDRSGQSQYGENRQSDEGLVDGGLIRIEYVPILV